jgi:hypothetical protein
MVSRKKVPGAYSKSVSSAIKKVQENGRNFQNPEHLFAELVAEFLLKEPLVDEIDVNQAYLLKGKEACKIVSDLEMQADGKMQFQIYGDDKQKTHALRTEGILKNLRGPIQEKDLDRVAARLSKAIDS